MTKRVTIPKDGFRIHPDAEIFAMLEDKEFEELVESIRRDGLEEPISVINDQIIDGRNRYKALQRIDAEGGHCTTLADNPDSFRDVSCRFASQGENTLEPIDYVLALNLHRRHLNNSQRAAAAVILKKREAERAKLRRQATQNNHAAQEQRAEVPSSEPQGKAAEIAARTMNVGKQAVYDAEKVADHGTPELQAAVRDGKVAVSAAAAIAKEPPEVQREAVAGGKKGVSEAAKRVRQAKSTPSPNPTMDLENQIMAALNNRSEDDRVEILRRLADRIAGSKKGTVSKTRSLSDDELFEQAAQLIREEWKVSFLMLQNKFAIDTARTSRLIERLRAAGVIAPDVVIEPPKDFETIVNLIVSQLSDSQRPRFIKVLQAIANNPDVGAIRRHAERLSKRMSSSPC